MIKVIDEVSGELLGFYEVELGKFSDQIKVEKVVLLKNSPGSLRIRVQVLWSKLQHFQSQLLVAEEKLNMAIQEKKALQSYLEYIDEGFGIIIRGLIPSIMDNDVLNIPKEKEEIVDKKRMSVLPRASIQPRIFNTSFAEKIDQTVGSALSNILF